MKRNWKLITPLALTALGALAAGLSVLLQKTENAASAASAAAGKAAPAKGPVLSTSDVAVTMGVTDSVRPTGANASPNNKQER